MVYALQLNLQFRNTTRRDAAAALIDARIGEFPRWSVTSVTSVGSVGLQVEARFVSSSDCDTVWAELDARLGTGTNGPIVGSRAWRHDCRHDEGVGTCTVLLERVWT